MGGLMGRLSVLLLLLGIVLPLGAWLVENLSHICEQVFFNPLPTPLHDALWLSLPLSNLWLWLALRRPGVTRWGLGLA